MVALPAVDTGLEFLMAVEAFFIRYFLAQDMTLGAVEGPFQIRMIFGEIARG